MRLGELAELFRSLPLGVGEGGRVLNKCLCFLGTKEGLRLCWTLETAFQSMFDAPSKIGPIVSMSVTLDEALVPWTVLHNVMSEDSIMRRRDLDEDLYGTTTLSGSRVKSLWRCLATAVRCKERLPPIAAIWSSIRTGIFWDWPT